MIYVRYVSRYIVLYLGTIRRCAMRWPRQQRASAAAAGDDAAALVVGRQPLRLRDDKAV
jgi:hypothetical protein